MNITNNRLKYINIFQEWITNRTPISYREIFKYTPKLNEIFKPCYLPESAKGEPFYKVRHALPKYWFVSDRGVIISVENGVPELKYSLIDGDNDQIKNEFYYKNHYYQLAVEDIVAIVFNDRANITEEATRIIEDKGVKAFMGYEGVATKFETYIEPKSIMNTSEVLKVNLTNWKPENLIVDTIH